MFKKYHFQSDLLSTAAPPVRVLIVGVLSSAELRLRGGDCAPSPMMPISGRWSVLDIVATPLDDATLDWSSCSCRPPVVPPKLLQVKFEEPVELQKYCHRYFTIFFSKNRTFNVQKTNLLQFDIIKRLA